MSRNNKKHRYQTVLALDGTYMPMQEISRRKALKALVTGRAHALDLKTWTKLGFQDVVAKPFQVVVFSKVKAVPEAKLGCGRGANSILKRDKHRCQYEGCNRRGTTIDHVQPRAQGGLSTWSNEVACCPECNARKGGRTPEQAGMRLKAPIKSQRAVLLERFHALVAAG